MTGSLWDRFVQLTDTPAKQIATVTAIDGSAVTVQFLGGRLATLDNTGGYAIGSRVFVAGSKIVGTAPNLRYFEAEV